MVEADDHIKGQSLKIKEKFALAGKMNTSCGRRKKDLSDEIELVKGMKVMVTRNLNTDLDIANRSRGVIVDIIVHSSKPVLRDAAIVKLKQLPAYVLVKLDQMKAMLKSAL
ncbi:hypothetical protein LXA43DRAFT_1102432 [Ganoderma leucocontextum]|nr:hypothetical protein LXA43DRAFT_1102432 [Ganoderma leucocontextum]